MEKKILILFLIVLIIMTLFCNGCGSSSPFHPPGWIQGLWQISSTTTILFEFTTDDVIQYSGFAPSYQKISFKALYKDVAEDIGSSHYAFTLYDATTFRFDLNLDGTLSFGAMTLVKQK